MFKLTCDICNKESTNPFKSGYIEVSIGIVGRNNRIIKHLCPKCASISTILDISAKKENTLPAKDSDYNSANKEE